MDHISSTHADIEHISLFPHEKEVLFFPFSSFEIRDIKEKNIKGQKVYEIELLYLGKYLKDILKDKNLFEAEENIPDSKFKKEIIKFGLIKSERIYNKRSVKILFEKYENYKHNHLPKSIKIHIRRRNQKNSLKIMALKQKYLKRKFIHQTQK